MVVASLKTVDAFTLNNTFSTAAHPFTLLREPRLLSKVPAHVPLRVCLAHSFPTRSAGDVVAAGAGRLLAPAIPMLKLPGLNHCSDTPLFLENQR